MFIRPGCLPQEKKMSEKTPVKVNILLHGMSENRSGSAELPEGTDVRDAVMLFARQQGLPLSENFAMICMVNGRRASEKSVLSDGDSLEAFQILGGG